MHVVARYDGDLSEAQKARVAFLLVDASARVRRYCQGQQFTKSTTTERLQVRNGRVVLPQRPVLAVTSVQVLGSAVSTTFIWEGLDSLAVGANTFGSFGWEPFRFGLTVVDVTYEHGYDPIPDDIIGVVCSIVLRSLGQSPTATGVTSETLGGYSYTTGTIGAAGPFGLLPDERETLDAYRREAGFVTTASITPYV